MGGSPSIWKMCFSPVQGIYLSLLFHPQQIGCPKLSVCLLLCWVYDSFPGQNPAQFPGGIFIGTNTCYDSGNAKQKNGQVFLCFFLHLSISVSHQKAKISAYFLTSSSSSSSSSHDIPTGFCCYHGPKPSSRSVAPFYLEPLSECISHVR